MPALDVLRRSTEALNAIEQGIKAGRYNPPTVTTIKPLASTRVTSLVRFMNKILIFIVVMRQCLMLSVTSFACLHHNIVSYLCVCTLHTLQAPQTSSTDSPMDRFKRYGSMRRQDLLENIGELSARMSNTLKSVSVVSVTYLCCYLQNNVYWT